MNIPTRTSIVIKSLNFLISINFKFRNYIFQLLHCNIDEERESSLLVNNQIHSHNTRSNNQLSNFPANRPNTKYCVLHNGTITWIHLFLMY